MFPDLMRDDVFRLETRRLWLRWPRAADAAAVRTLAGDKEVAQMTAFIPHPYPEGAVDEWIVGARTGNASGETLSLVLTPKHKPDAAIGSIALRQGAPGELKLGYWLGRPHWGQGLATEATQALVDLAFTLTGAKEIEAAARVINPASQRVLEKSGFTWVGSGLRNFPARGGMQPCENFRLEARAWAGRRGWMMPVIERRADTPVNAA